MESDIVGKKKADKETVRIHLVGVVVFQNELLANFIQDQTGLHCRCLPLERFTEAFKESCVQKSLTLLDCIDLSVHDVWSLLKLEWKPKFDDRILALSHVVPGWKIERQALDFGVRGILYEDQEIAFYPKAVRAIMLNDELWYPRRVLEKHILSNTLRPISDKQRLADLTPREKEILLYLATGLSNHEIAKRLCISSHTVKTHAHRIYKKIKVTNRLNAALWLSEKE